VVRILSFDLSWLIPFLLIAGGWMFMKGGRREVKQTGRIAVGVALILVSLGMIADATASLRESELLPVVVGYLSEDYLTSFLIGALFTWFVLDYLTFERVHLYTYDLFAERVGFKLGWGCLTFYPYFYPIGLWALADEPSPGPHPALLVGAAVTFFAGWALARGANMQKYLFKRDPGRPFLGFIRPRTVSDGERQLLCSGFWGVSRHVNYLGEILMATGLALSLGMPTSPWPWLYPLYYVLLLVPRERDDDARCAAKYGELWDRYRQRVPSRIIPRIY